MDDALASDAIGDAAPRRAAGSTVLRLPQRAERVCVRPGCGALAESTLSFSYQERRVELAPLLPERLPQTYDLCTAHAARTRPPHGWQLRDRRPEDSRPPVGRGAVPADLGGDRTVAVLAAALRAVPGAVSEDAAAPTAEIPAASPDARRSTPADDVPAARPVPAAEERSSHRD